MSMATRQPYLDVLRALACVAVVLLHSAGGVLSAQVGTADWHICNMIDGSVRWAVPVFVMISGSLFLASEKPFSAIVRTNVVRLVVAFAFWSLVYALYGMCIGNLNAVGFLYDLVFGHFHMWYVPMLIGLYLLTPLLRPIARDDVLSRLFLAMALVVTFLVPQLAGVLGCFSEELAGCVTRLVEQFGLDFVAGYSTYYVLGYRLSRWDRHPRRLTFAIAFVAANAVTVLGTLALSVCVGDFVTVMYDYMTVNVLVAAVTLFLLLRASVGFARQPMRGSRLIAMISRRSFGIYLVHPLVIDALGLLGLRWSTFAAAVSVPFVALLAVSISLAVSTGLSKVPVLGRCIA